MLEPRLIRSLISWKTMEYKVKTVTFSSVHHLSLHFPTNFSEDIGLAGKCTEANRVGKINAVYEAREIPYPRVRDLQPRGFAQLSSLTCQRQNWATEVTKRKLLYMRESLYHLKTYFVIQHLSKSLILVWVWQSLKKHENLKEGTSPSTRSWEKLSLQGLCIRKQGGGQQKVKLLKLF